MKIAYLASLYPAQSHTFIEREIAGLRDLELEIVTFSIRRASPGDVLGATAEAESRRTRWLVPPAWGAMLYALLWAAFTRPILTLNTLRFALANTAGIKQKLKWLAYYLEAILFASWIHQEKAQHLHCHFGNAGSNTAMLAARIAKVPLSITFHGIDLDEPILFHHADKLSQCKFAVCISEYGRQLLLANTDQAHAHKVHVIRCGYVPPSEEAVAPLPHAGRIVCVARLSAEKGHAVLLNALHLLKERKVPFHCTLVGGGPLEHDLRAQAEQLGLNGCVTFTGALPPTEVAAQIQMADISVLASFGEGIPVVLLEAFAHKRPVVATRVGGISELVRPGENGYLVEAGDPIALADALQTSLSDPGLSEAYGEAGRRTVLSDYNPAVSAAKLKALFTAEGS